ncbi:unnamed protein product, partial [Polarella glacialis]
AGKWRTVTWSKMEATPASGALALPPSQGKYYVAGSWNNFRFEEMTREGAESSGSFSCEVTLQSGTNQFQIVRNADWHQTIHPDCRNAGADAEIVGPEERAEKLCWSVSSSRGETLTIFFQRTVDDLGKSSMKVSWR